MLQDLKARSLESAVASAPLGLLCCGEVETLHSCTLFNSPLTARCCTATAGRSTDDHYLQDTKIVVPRLITQDSAYRRRCEGRAPLLSAALTVSREAWFSMELDLRVWFLCFIDNTTKRVGSVVCDT